MTNPGRTADMVCRRSDPLARALSRLHSPQQLPSISDLAQSHLHHRLQLFDVHVQNPPFFTNGPVGALCLGIAVDEGELSGLAVGCERGLPFAVGVEDDTPLGLGDRAGESDLALHRLE